VDRQGFHDALAIVLVVGWFALRHVGFCQCPVLKSIDTRDHSVKASLFETDCGAMTAKRVHIALSNSFVDGRRFGEIVVTLLNVSDSDVRMEWASA
jgi:hypothetical protein